MCPRPARAVRALVLALAALGSLAAPAPVRAQSGELPDELRTVADVRFRGRHALSARKLRGANLHTHKPSLLPWRERPALRHDYLLSDSASVVQLYSHYGFPDAQVHILLEPTRDPRAARVVFVVTEGMRVTVSRVDLTGVHVYNQNEVRKPLLAQAKVAFDPAFLPIDTLRIRALYRERGYFVSVGSSSRRGVPDTAHVAVRYDVLEGRQHKVGAISFPEAPNVRSALGRRELLLKTGDIYNESRLNLSIERLYQTTLYRQVQVSPAVDSSANTVSLDFRVSERKRRWVDAGIGSGTTDRIRTTAEWGHRNLDTHALSAVVASELSLYGQDKSNTGYLHQVGASATLGKPWLFGVRLQGQTSVFSRQANERIYSNVDSRNPIFVQATRTNGFSFTLLRELGRSTRVSLTQENTFVRQSYDILLATIATVSDPNVTIADSLNAITIHNYHSNTLRLTLQRDFRNQRIAPTRGSYQTFFTELAGGPLRGQSSYRKAALSSTWYTPLANGWGLATRASGGLMRPVGSPPSNFTPELNTDPDVARVPLDARFKIGGVNSVRGYGENQITASGGLAMVLANAELRVPLAGPLGLEVFLDGGNVWSRPEYMKARDFILPWQATRVREGDLRYSYGLGGRLLLPFGPLRVDVAWGGRPDFPRSPGLPFAYQFAIGPSF